MDVGSIGFTRSMAIDHPFRELDQGKNEKNTISLVKKVFRLPILAGGSHCNDLMKLLTFI